jgi:hypothetical protein
MPEAKFPAQVLALSSGGQAQVGAKLERDSSK